MSRMKQADIDYSLNRIKEFGEQINRMSRAIESLEKSMVGVRDNDRTIENLNLEIWDLRARVDILAPIVESFIEGKIDPRVKDRMHRNHPIDTSLPFTPPTSPRIRR